VYFPIVNCILLTVKRLAVCEELDNSSCGSVLFFSQIFPPVFDPLTFGEAPLNVPQPQLAIRANTGEGLL